MSSRNGPQESGNVPMPMDKFETFAWFDENTNVLNVKVRLCTKTVVYDQTNGHHQIVIKKGVILKISEEILATIAEGQEYPQYAVDAEKIEPYEERFHSPIEDEGYIGSNR